MAALQLQARVAEEGEVLGEGAAVGARGRAHRGTCTPQLLLLVDSRRGRSHSAPWAPLLLLLMVDSRRGRGPGAGLDTPAVGGGLAHGQVAGPGPGVVVGVVHAMGALRGEHLSGGRKWRQGWALYLASTRGRGPWCGHEGWAIVVIVIHNNDIIIILRTLVHVCCEWWISLNRL